MHQPMSSPARWATSALLLVIGAVHLPLVPDHLEEAPYAGVLFLSLAVACAVLAVVLALRDTPLVWALSGALVLLALVAFLVSRTVGLPQLDDDIGNWTEPLGLPAVAAELLTFTIACAALKHRSLHPSKGTT